MTGLTTDGRVVDRTLTVFYGVVATVALAGQAGAAVEWLRWPWPVATGAVAAVELGGVAVAAYRDYRRRLGERAVAAGVLSGAVAVWAVLVNWFGHYDRMQAGFFAGMSALGYAVWVIHSGARRRDQLRAAGTLPPVAPVYGVAQWMRHPGLTRAARALALAAPGLGAIGSLRAAREAERARTRQAAIADVMRRRITESVDRSTAEIATAVYDLDQIAARLAEAADYDTLARLVGADLAPERLAQSPAHQGVGEQPDERVCEQLSEQPDEQLATVTDEQIREQLNIPVRRVLRKRTQGAQPPAHERVRAAHEQAPEATHQQLAEQLGVSVSTVRRARPARVNGSPKEES